MLTQRKNIGILTAPSSSTSIK